MPRSQGRIDLYNNRCKSALMSSALAESEFISVEEYLGGEERSEIRHEYLDGAVVEMAGASDRHNILAGNIFASLHGQLRGKRCQAFIADMKLRLRVRNEDNFYYPDIMVACDPADNAALYRERPTALIEVLSGATERVDRREKLWRYWELPSLECCALVEQDRMEITLLRRASDWNREVLREPGDILALDGTGCAITLADIYERSGL